MSGWMKLYRGWMEHEIFTDNDEKIIWLWLIEAAEIDKITRNICGNPVILQRGQMSHSLRFIADQCSVSKNKISRFLEKLKKRDMIRIESGTGQNIITICNYSKYQDKKDNGGTGAGQQTGQERDRSGTNKEELKNIRKEDPPPSSEKNFKGKMITITEKNYDEFKTACPTYTDEEFKQALGDLDFAFDQAQDKKWFWKLRKVLEIHHDKHAKRRPLTFEKNEQSKEFLEELMA